MSNPGPNELAAPALGLTSGPVPNEGRAALQQLAMTASEAARLQSGNLGRYLLANRRFNVRDFDAAAGSYVGGPFTRNDAPVIQLACDTAALQADLLGAPCEVVLPSGIYLVSGQTLVVDLGKIALRGVGGAVVLLSDNGAGLPVLNLYSSIAAEAQATNTASFAGHFEVRGLSVPNSIGIVVGNASFPAAGSQLYLQGIAARRFGTNWTYTSNAYRINHANCASFDANAGGQHILWPVGLGNAGECIRWEHAMIANSNGAASDAQMAEVLIAGNSAQFDFVSCSLLNCRLRTTGECDINWIGGNIENPGTAFGYRMIDVGTAGRVNVLWSRLVLNDFGSPNQVPPFHVNADARGLVLQGLQYPGGTFLDFGGATGVRQVVSGTGALIVRDCVPFGSPSAWGGQAFPILGEAASVTHNPGFESGALAPWAGGPFGTGGTTVVNATAALRGAFGVQVTLTGGGTGGVEYAQAIPVCPGTLCTGHITYRIVSGGANAFVQMQFLNSAGAVINTVSSAALTATVRTEQVIVGFAPAGAVTVRCIWAVTTASAAGVAYIDDAIFNAT